MLNIRPQHLAGDQDQTSPMARLQREQDEAMGVMRCTEDSPMPAGDGRRWRHLFAQPKEGGGFICPVCGAQW